MVKCIACKSEVPLDAKFCPNCGTQVGVKRDVYKVSGDGLIGKVKEILNDAKVKRVVIKDDKGKVLLSIPVTWGAAGAAALMVLAPWLAALGVIAGIVTRCTIEVEKSSDK
jgi:CBS domain-containing protein